MVATNLSYLGQIGLPMPEVSVALTFAECEAPLLGGEAGREGLKPKESDMQHDSSGGECKAASELEQQNFEVALGEALDSALTKFDCLAAMFDSGRTVPDITQLLVEEIRGDSDFEPLLVDPDRQQALQAFVRTHVGKAFGTWKKAGGTAAKKPVAEGAREGGVLLPWASIEAYPEWVLNQLDECAGAPPEEQEAALQKLERSLLEKPVIAASIKFDGTCFGKMDTGELVGRRAVLGPECQQYQRTSTAAAAPCDVAALRRVLAEQLHAELGPICVWGELMCNPNYYGYKDRGLADRWLCFGAVAAFTSPDATTLSQRLTSLGLAHSVGSRQVRLLLCPALRRLLQDVAGCEVAEEPFHGLSHADMVARGVAGLRAGEDEGIVLVFERPNGQASVRKWKNSAEGANARQKEAQRLQRCLVRCEQWVSEGKLDTRVAEMVNNLRSVAEAETKPQKAGRGGGKSAA